MSDADIITNVVWTGVACLETPPIETATVAAEGVPASDAEISVNRHAVQPRPTRPNHSRAKRDTEQHTKTAAQVLWIALT